MNWLADIKKRLDAITPGAWRWNGGTGVFNDRKPHFGGPQRIIRLGSGRMADMEFCAHAPEDMRRIISEYEAVCKELDQYKMDEKVRMSE